MKQFLFVTAILWVAGWSFGSEVLDVDELLGAGSLFKGLKVEIPAFGRSASSQARAQFDQALQQPGVLDSAYGNFAVSFNKSTALNEGGTKDTFKKSILTIFEHNVVAKSGLSSFTMGVNEFSDLTLDQVIERYTGVVEPSTTTPDLSDGGEPTISPSGGLARSTPGPYKNWLEQGHVTPPRHQGRKCNSCVPFALIAALESAMSLYSKVKGLDLSEQEVVDCPIGDGIGRCSGNWPAGLLAYMTAEGITTEAEYGYEGEVKTCAAAGKRKVAKVSKHFRLKPDGDEQKLKAWVWELGPVSTIMALNDEFRYYKSGVMDAPCENKRLVHNVLTIGYGTDNGQDYWLAKNSWGTGWGDGGYVKIARNKGSLCRIADHAILVQAPV